MADRSGWPVTLVQAPWLRFGADTVLDRAATELEDRDRGIAGSDRSPDPKARRWASGHRVPFPGGPDQPESGGLIVAKHTRESATAFWMRMGSRPLIGVGSLLALASLGLAIAAVVGGVWYLIVTDLLDSPEAALWSAVPGALVVFVAVVVGGVRVLRSSPESDERSPR